MSGPVGAMARVPPVRGAFTRRTDATTAFIVEARPIGDAYWRPRVSPDLTYAVRSPWRLAHFRTTEDAAWRGGTATERSIVPS